MTAQRAASILEVPVADAAGMSAALEADGYLESRPPPSVSPRPTSPRPGWSTTLRGGGLTMAPQPRGNQRW